MGGVHYWEIKAERRKYAFKIGVCSNKDMEFDVCFSDFDYGWAYYGGYLRHANSTTGKYYGKKLEEQGILGVLLNMNTGTLSFSLNGEYMGVAF